MNQNKKYKIIPKRENAFINVIREWPKEFVEDIELKAREAAKQINHENVGEFAQELTKLLQEIQEVNEDAAATDQYDLSQNDVDVEWEKHDSSLNQLRSKLINLLHKQTK